MLFDEMRAKQAELNKNNNNSNPEIDEPEERKSHNKSQNKCSRIQYKTKNIHTMSEDQ